MSHREVIYIPEDKNLISIYDLAELYWDKKYPVTIWRLFKKVILEKSGVTEELLKSDDIALLMEIFSSNSDLKLGATYHRKEARRRIIENEHGKLNFNRVIQSKRAKGGMRLLNQSDNVIWHNNYPFTPNEILEVFSYQLPTDLNVEQIKFWIYLSEITEKEWVDFQKVFSKHQKKPAWDLSVQFTKPKDSKRKQIEEIAREIFVHLFEFKYVEEFNESSNYSIPLSYNSTISMTASIDFLNRNGFDVQLVHNEVPHKNTRLISPDLLPVMDKAKLLSEIGKEGANITNKRHKVASERANFHAQKIWSLNSTLTKEDVAIKILIYLKQEGIDNYGEEYSIEIVKEWIKENVPLDRKKGGRPRNSEKI